MTDSLQSFRDKTIVLRRIETLQLSRCLPDLYASVGIRYMLALLSSNFNPLSEEALKTLSKLGEMDPKRFWVAFERALTSVCKSSSPGQDDKCSLELDAKNQLVYVDMDEDMSLFESASASIIPVSTKKIQGRSSAANNSGSSAAKLVHSNVSFEDIAIFKLSERFISAYSMANNVVKWTCKKFVEVSFYYFIFFS